MKRRHKAKPPTFDAEGYQTNLGYLNGTPLPDLDGTIPESYARTADKKLLTAWIKAGLIAHRRAEKFYALTPKGEARIR